MGVSAQITDLCFIPNIVKLPICPVLGKIPQRLKSHGFNGALFSYHRFGASCDP